MQLIDFIPNIKKKYSKISFSGISFDSTKVKKNNIFFAIKGNNIDGNNFIPIVIKKGCKIIITENARLFLRGLKSINRSPLTHYAGA